MRWNRLECIKISWYDKATRGICEPLCYFWHIRKCFIWCQDFKAGNSLLFMLNWSSWSTYLNIIWGRLVACPLEGLCHIAKDLHWWEKVTSVKVPALGEIQEVLGNLGHPITRQHPLALCKMTLNLQEQQKKELGASVSSSQFVRYISGFTFGVNGVQKNSILLFDTQNELIWIKGGY